MLVVQHAGVEHAGAFAGWWEAAGVELVPLRPFAGDPIPAAPDGYDGLVVLGGPQSVCRAAGGVDPAEYALVRAAVDGGVPMLGICLGAQILARACGGEVAVGTVPEHGVATVTLTAAAADDPLFASLPAGSHAIVQWHGDGVTRLPAEATLLASGEVYPVQAFRIGDRAWGLQFHAEAGTEMARAWAADDGIDFAPLAPALEALDLEPTWRPVAERFAGLVRAGADGGG